MVKENEKKEEKIEVDKDFLTRVLELLTILKERVDLIEQGGLKSKTPPNKVISPQKDYVFQCAEVQSVNRIPPTPEDIIRYTQRSEEFRKKVETLMKEYKVMQFTAFFLKKL